MGTAACQFRVGNPCIVYQHVANSKRVLNVCKCLLYARDLCHIQISGEHLTSPLFQFRFQLLKPVGFGERRMVCVE